MEYDVHFTLTGCLRITADDEDDAVDKMNELISEKTGAIEELLDAQLYDNDHFTEVNEV